MSKFNWCHGPECHKRHTLGRIRGVKGNKVLRTRKVTPNSWSRHEWGTRYFDYFCDDTCMRDYMHAHIRELIAIAPRSEPLETSIEVQSIKGTDWRGNPYTHKKIVEA
jgi:hypothetical protein